MISDLVTFSTPMMLRYSFVSRTEDNSCSKDFMSDVGMAGRLQPTTSSFSIPSKYHHPSKLDKFASPLRRIFPSHYGAFQIFGHHQDTCKRDTVCSRCGEVCQYGSTCLKRWSCSRHLIPWCHDDCGRHNCRSISQTVCGRDQYCQTSFHKICRSTDRLYMAGTISNFSSSLNFTNQNWSSTQNPTVTHSKTL